MTDAAISTTNDYIVGRGRLFFNKFAPGTLNGTGELYFGNTPSLEYTQAKTDLKHYSAEQGLKVQDGAVTLQNDITAQFTCDNIDLDNLDLWWGADSTSGEQIATGSSAALVENFTCYGGKFYQLGVSAANPMGLSNIDPLNMSAISVVQTFAAGTFTFTAQPAVNDTVTINGDVITFVAANASGPEVNIGGNFGGTAENLAAYINFNDQTLEVTASVNGAVLTMTANAAGTGGNAITIAKSSAGIAVSGATLTGGTAGSSEALIANVDWNPDPDGGRFQIIPGGAVADDSEVQVTYKLLGAFIGLGNTNEEDVYGSLRFVADNPVGDNTDYFFPYVILRSNGNMQMKGDTWQEMTFSAEVLKLPNMQRTYLRKRPGSGE